MSHSFAASVALPGHQGKELEGLSEGLSTASDLESLELSGRGRKDLSRAGKDRGVFSQRHGTFFGLCRVA